MTGLYVPEGDALWVGELKRELLAFPAGKHDDQVDALGIVGQLLDMAVYGTPPPGPKIPLKPKDYSQVKVPRPHRGRPTPFH